jgi:hypothetical protein
MTEAERLGRQRYHDRRATGSVDRAVALPFAPEETDAIAAQAEAWWGRLYGLRIKRGRSPDAGDFTCGKNVIDVKWTPRPDGRLVSFIDARVQATVYVLVTGMPDSFVEAGWEWGYLHRKRIGDAGYGPRNVTEHLRPNVALMMATLCGRKRR